MKSADIPPFLRWACRRGMLELDVLLGNFLEQVFPHLPTEEQTLFIHLVEESDYNLFKLLMSDQKPLNPELANIVEKICNHAKRHCST